MNSSQPIYDASKLGYGKMAILGIQHLFAMFGATILVPILVNSYFHGEGLSIQVTLFFAGLGTILFHFLAKWKVPAFLGSSFAFLGGFATVAELKSGKFADMTYGQKLPYACGGIVVAGLLYLILAVYAEHLPVVGIAGGVRELELVEERPGPAGDEIGSSDDIDVVEDPVCLHMRVCNASGAYEGNAELSSESVHDGHFFSASAPAVASAASLMLSITTGFFGTSENHMYLPVGQPAIMSRTS